MVGRNDAVSISSLFLLESGFGPMIGALCVITVPVALFGLLLPVREARRRIREAKARELNWCRDKLREARAALAERLIDTLLE